MKRFLFRPMLLVLLPWDIEAFAGLVMFLCLLNINNISKKNVIII